MPKETDEEFEQRLKAIGRHFRPNEQKVYRSLCASARQIRRAISDQAELLAPRLAAIKQMEDDLERLLVEAEAGPR